MLICDDNTGKVRWPVIRILLGTVQTDENSLDGDSHSMAVSDCTEIYFTMMRIYDGWNDT